MPVLNERTRRQSVVRLKVMSMGGSTQVCEVGPDSTVIVGSGRNCGLQLADPDVLTLHAIFRQAADELWLQPWHADAMICVNGMQLGDDVQLAAGDEIQIGSHRIVVDHSANAGQTTPRSEPHQEQLPTAITQADVQAHAPRQTDEPLSWENGPESSSFETSDDAPLRVAAQDEMYHDDFSGPDRDDCPGHEAIDLLQAEIALLQSELIERDSQIAGLASRQSADIEECVTRTDAEDTVPASRLEQSLCELEQSDQRIAELERLLSLAEEARNAASDERQQIESWVGEIEGRIEQWMTERRAELDLLRNQLRQAKAECDRLREQVQRGAQTQDETDSAKSLQLQHRYAELQEALQRTESERDQLREQLQQAEIGADHRQRAEADTALREEGLQLAQERASLARERSELENARVVSNEGLRETAPRQDGDRRVRAFREHLREIHDQEQEDPPERGLGSRLARLWRRLDGNRSG